MFPPIGRPVANTQMYFLDEHLQQVPVSVPGQLYSGGVCLARGYLNRLDMTAERCIPDHLSNQPGGGCIGLAIWLAIWSMAISRVSVALTIK